MKNTIVLACLAGLMGGAAAAAPALPGPAFPNFDKPGQVKAACDKGLAQARQRLKQLERHPADGLWLAASDDLTAYIEDAYYPIGLLSNVHPNKAVRDASQACELRWQDFSSSLGLNEKLYQAALKVQPKDDIDREARRLTLEGFEDSGVALPADKRPRAKQLSDRITDLGLQFDKNIRDDGTKVAFTQGELKGVPENVWKNAKRDAAGRIVLGLEYPSYLPVMQNAESGATRERMWRAKTNEGGDANLKLLGEIARLRRDYAHLFGFDSYADFTLRRRMALDTAHTTRFLNDVKAAVSAGEARDLAELRAAKAAHLQQPPEATQLNRWDVAFYTERVRRERYSVDQEAFRQYFPPQESLQFVMKLAERMFGVRYTRMPDVKLWHPDVQAYAATDVATGKPLATLLVDLYPRDGKYNHAAVWSYRGGATRNSRTPQAALVVNFDRKGLTLDELETLLHEFGHALHNNLSATRYVGQAGTGTVRDFVEAPSQMLEDWVYDKHALTVFAEVCPTCKAVPDDLLAKAKIAKDYAKGTQTARQHLYASYDLALHAADAPEPMALWSRMEGATPLGHVQGTKFPAGFSHVAGGYAAGYYGYLWSLVVAMDLRTAFERDRLDPVVGRRYRDIVLGNGGQVPPQQLLREFLGRETNSKAFYDDLKKAP
jgi:thimet oligopeptidase